MSRATTILTAVDDHRRSQEAAQPGYRAVNPLAVVSLALGGLSLVSFLGWGLAVIPISAVLLGMRALIRIHAAPDEYVGAGLAKAGIALGVLFWAGGWGWLTYAAAIEVPEGYELVDYQTLQPGEGLPADSIPASARALDGKRIFIKGYVYPTSQIESISRFVLCRDNGDCCFGGSPKLTDMIDVALVDPLRLSYSRRLHSVGGVFHVLKQGDPQARGAVYRLEADHLK